MSFDILSVAIVLGFAILFHECGHFAAAKLVGIRVLKFSLGFGPKIFSFKKGHTEYILSAFPLGGYVRMAGDEWGEEHELNPWEFLAQPPMRRNFVVLAGPVMNVVLAFIFYFLILSVFGNPFVGTTEIGVVMPDSPGEEAGLRPGQRILSVEGKSMENWEDVLESASILDEESLSFEVASATGTFSCDVVVSVTRSADLLNTVPPIVAYVVPESAAESLGIRTGDEIMKVNGVGVSQWGEVREQISGQWVENSSGERQGLPVDLSWQDTAGQLRQGSCTPEVVIPEGSGEPVARIGFSVRFPIIYSDPNYVSSLGIAPAIQPIIGNVSRGSPAQEAGIQPGDVLLSIDGHEIDNWYAAARIIAEAFVLSDAGVAEGRPMSVAWLGKEQEIHTEEITPYVNKEYQEVYSGQRTAIAHLGISPQTDREYPGIFRSFYMAFETLFRNFILFIAILFRLVTAQISPKVIGGPIEIMRMSAQFGREGLRMFLGFMAMINLNLAIVNLLPIPIVDGGHILLYSIEAVRKKRFTARQMEIAMYIGFAILVPIIVWVFYNDLSRFDWGRLLRFFKSSPSPSP